MKKATTFLCGALLGAAMLIPLSLDAQDSKKPAGDCGDCGGCEGGKDMTTPAAKGCCGDEAMQATGDGGMNGADPAAMQAAWEAAARPGESHRKLDAIVGTWTVKSTWFCDPSKVQETTGVSVNTWALGGRFVEQRFFGAMPGSNAPFEGIGFTGFDNVTGKFVGTWLDNQSTGAMLMQGQADKTGAITFTSECAVPGGGSMKYRMELKVESRDRHLFTMWMQVGDQPEMKGAEMVYTRK